MHSSFERATSARLKSTASLSPAQAQSGKEHRPPRTLSLPSEPPERRDRALLFACGTVAIERFAFYSFVSLFVLFLTERCGQSEAAASTWYGVMMGVTYFTPLFGGAVADRMGRWHCISIGAFLLAIAYGLLGAGFLFLSIVLLSIGMGLFKSNITAAVGSLYQTGTERDRALTRFYLAVNIGALPSGICSGVLARYYGYSSAFRAAGAACLLAAGLWLLAERSLLDAHAQTASAESQAPVRDRLLTLLVLLPVSLLFFLSFHQNGASLTLFAKDHTELSLLGVEIEAPWFQSANAALVIGLTPLLDRLWRRFPLASHHKFLLGMCLSAASSLVMSCASWSGGNTGRVSPWWLLTTYFVLSVGELCVAPIGFSLVAKLAPRRLLGVLMGAWFAAIALGNLGAGLIGRYWTAWPHHRFFIVLAATSGIAALLLMSQQRRLGRVLSEKKE